MVVWVAAGQVRHLPKRGIRATAVTPEVATQVELRTGNLVVVAVAQETWAITQWMALVVEPLVVMAVTA